MAGSTPIGCAVSPNMGKNHIDQTRVAASLGPLPVTAVLVSLKRGQFRAGRLFDGFSDPWQVGLIFWRS